MSHLDKMLDEQGKELNELVDDFPAADVSDVADERATELHERTMAAVGAISTEDERTRAWRAFLVADDMSVWRELNIRLTSARVAAETMASADEVQVDREEAATAARTAFDDITCLVEIAEHDTALETAVLEEQVYLAQQGSDATGREENE